MRPFPLAQGPHAFLKVRGLAVKVVRAVVSRGIADVIQVIGLGRIQRRVDLTLAVRAYRPGRQSREDPRVVGRAAVHIAQVNLPIVAPFAGQL